MGKWNVDAISEPGILRLELEGKMEPPEMGAFVDAHNRAVDGYAGRDYKVFCDISKMLPLSPECAALFERAKRHSAAQKGFQGSGVLVASATVAMQHRRTSTEGGVMGTELISSDESEIRAHLRTVRRNGRR